MWKLTVAQTISSAELDTNLQTMRRFCDQAKAEGARAIAFAEMAYFTGSALENRRMADRFDSLCETFSAWARELQLYILPGSLRSLSGGTKSGKCFNHAVVFDPLGKRIADYRKIFLFKANLSDRRYDESELYDPGDSLTVLDIEGVRVGVAICFDLRFPEMFRALRKRGAEVIFVPSAFTVPTGKAHWEILLKARAIENQCFIVAPSLTGVSGDGAGKYGHSLVIDPWGQSLIDLGSAAVAQTVSLDFKQISEVQAKIDALASLRPDLFPIA